MDPVSPILASDFLTAWAAGIVSHATPCVVPVFAIGMLTLLVTPGFVPVASTERRWLILRKGMAHLLLFVVGFCGIFVLTGLPETYLGRRAFVYLPLIRQLGGLGTAFFGVYLALGLAHGRPFASPPKAGPLAGWLGSLLLGAAVAAGWSPCPNPFLTALIIYAGANSGWLGVGLLSAYALGVCLFPLTGGLILNLLLLPLQNTKFFSILFVRLGGVLLCAVGVALVFDALPGGDTVAEWYFLLRTGYFFS